MKRNIKLLMANTFGIRTNVSLRFKQTRVKSLFLIILFSSAIFFFNNLLNIHPVTAFSTLDQTIQQFQKSLESSINNEIQSIREVTDNITNCSNNVSFQTQSHNNSNYSILTDNNCSSNPNFPLISINTPIKNNMSGQITSAEYDTQSGKIMSSVFGNWSLKSGNGSQIDFITSFEKQPISNDLINQSSLTSPKINANANSSSLSVQNHLTTLGNKEYNFSNFRVDAIVQQNSDITYKGLIDATEKVISPISSNQTHTYHNLDVSISFLNGRVLVINFENQNSMSNEFRNIPLVGLIN